MADDSAAQSASRPNPAAVLMFPGQIIFLCFAVVTGVLVVMVSLYEYRRKRFEPEPTEDRVFRCDGCASVYTDDHDVDRSRCPECGLFNSPFVFCKETRVPRNLTNNKNLKSEKIYVSD